LSYSDVLRAQFGRPSDFIRSRLAPTSASLVRRPSALIHRIHGSTAAPPSARPASSSRRWRRRNTL